MNNPTAAEIEAAQQRLLALRAELGHPKYKIPAGELPPKVVSAYREELQDITNEIQELHVFLGIR